MAMTTEDMIKASQCFGIAFDPTVAECKQCDVHLRCEQKCRLGRAVVPTRPMPTMMAEPMEILEPDKVSKPQSSSAKTAKATAKSAVKTLPKKTVKEAVKSKTYSPDMPEFKGLSMAQMEQMVIERGGDLADFDKYKAENIRRMRLTMFLKSTYEV